MGPTAAPVALREVVTFRSRWWPLAAASLLAGCWFPVDRGQRLEQRVDRIEAEGPIRQVDGDRAAAQEQVRRVDAKLAELEGKLGQVAQAAKEGRGERSARQDGRLDKLAEEVSRLRAAIEGEARRLDSVEKRVADLRATASRGVPERKAAGPSETVARPPAPEPPRGKTGVLALAREQEMKGQKAVARDLYREYVNKYPTGPDAAQAHFRLGELAFGERRYQDAIAEYGKVAKEFPRSDEAPEAMLRTAESMIRIDLKDEAAAVLSEIPKRYPSSPAAGRAKERLADLTNRRSR